MNFQFEAQILERCCLLFVWLSLRNSLIYAGPIVINMSLLGLQTVTNNSNLVHEMLFANKAN